MTGIRPGWTGLPLRLLDDGFVHHEPPMRRETFWLAFAAIAILALILRFWNLDAAPIWADEGATLGFARLDWASLLFAGVDNHPPLSYLIQKAWMSLAPDPGLVRVPSALAGSATVAVLMLLARDLVGMRTALAAGLLLALSTGHVFFSQEARMYSWLTLGLALAAWGAIGHVAPGRLHPRAYAGLYVLGGAIAIYSQVLGLVAMGMVGLASLAAGLLTARPLAFARDWLVRNLVLFVLVLPWLIQIPGSMGTFPGLNAGEGLIDLQWMYRNTTGFAGLGRLSLPFELVLLGLAALGIVLAWRQDRRALALVLAGLLVLYPAALAILHQMTPLFANRIFLPASLAVCLGAAFTLSHLRLRAAGLASIALLAIAFAGSTQFEMRHRVKTENFPAALAVAEATGYAGAPVLTCNRFTTAAAWENAPQTAIYYSLSGELMRYHGPDYWRAAENSMTALRRMTIGEIDAYLGGGWQVEGGLAALAAENEQIIFFVRVCDKGDVDEAAIRAVLTGLGYRLEGERQRVGRRPPFHILEEPQSWVELYRRKA